MSSNHSESKRPMASAHRLSLFRREIRVSISPVAFEMLLRKASRISEGQIAPGGRYFGSTMLTIDLRQAEDQVRDACDKATAHRLVQLLEQEEHTLKQVKALALKEALNIAGCPLDCLELDLRIRTEGAVIYIDIDVEGQAQQRLGEAGR